ncbi:Sulfite exporter TauE/SafE [Shimia sp. SK013]|uniref:sulfite exporter TauE/SafE family protein n=1 Tax=Shimia sp. SK013 TaxID=1389006 RepID=UPI0006B63EC7|nr:sulfite exporter TauE/SafE family protein [Shimia sp. SK013]KPA23558.1 Sulfite exporter TauE/SafE [Shimia sp. SK013]
MDVFFSNLEPATLFLACGVAVLAGVIKGMVGFGMPMVLISGLSSFIAPELALAGLILPTLVTNGIQAFRQGIQAAWQSVRRFRRFLFAGGLTMLVSAQFVRVLPSEIMLLIIGIPVSVFAASQLLGRPIRIAKPSAGGEMAVGTVAGVLGGLSGVWGPPTVTYLTAIGTQKEEQIRVQGVVYGLGALLLVGAHLGSGVLNAKTVPFSIALIPPAILGMWVGGQISDRIDQDLFRKATLLILLLASLNLIRRGLLG